MQSRGFDEVARVQREGGERLGQSGEMLTHRKVLGQLQGEVEIRTVKKKRDALLVKGARR
jgi:hypothetical protein